MGYLNELNGVQREAVTHTEGPVLLIAGPGSGKTRVLTYRIAHIINQGISPYNILALTFTNKSAAEMKERILKVVGDNGRGLWIGTFHSIFSRILRNEADKIGYPRNFTIYDPTDTKSLMKTIIKEEGLPDNYKPNVVLNRISLAKNNLFGPKAYQNHTAIRKEDENSGRPKIGLLYEKYAKRCYKAGAMDFDDLLMKTFFLLEKFPEICEKYQDTFRYIMIDEFQDTNFVQSKIVQKLGEKYKNICAVGDDAQSIYAFRGANIQNILNYEKMYDDLVTYKLEQNYRSTDVIVQAANQIIKNNKGQLAKVIWTDNNEGNLIKVYEAVSDSDEARVVANNIQETRYREHNEYKDFAILYRTNAQSRSFEEWLRKLNIPYKIFGGLSFYSRKEIKDVMAYLRLIVNPKDEEAIKRVINYPVRGIGNTTIQKTVNAAEKYDKSIWEMLENTQMIEGLNGRAVNALDKFIILIKNLRTQADKLNAYELLQAVVRETGLLQDLYKDKTVEGVSRYENMQELLNSVKDFVDSRSELLTEDGTPAKVDMGAYMEDVSLITDIENEDEDTNKVGLMTVHAAKGLEFQYVYIVGMEEELFPSQLSMLSKKELEEERRLFYVAVTRAEKQLTLSSAQTRYKYGNLLNCAPSRFLDEINETLLDRPERSRKQQQKELIGNREERKPFSNPNLRPIGRNNTKKTPVAIDDSNFQADDPNLLKEGMQVLHSKFGEGKIIGIDGLDSGKIATIFFPNEGQKKIMLKYAKLQIVN